MSEKHNATYHGASVSTSVTLLLGTDDWVIIRNGHHLVTAQDLDDRELMRDE